MNKVTFEREIIGMSVQDAKKLAEKNDYGLRVVYEDGQHYMVTKDFRMTRCNVFVENGKIVEANHWG